MTNNIIVLLLTATDLGFEFKNVKIYEHSVLLFQIIFGHENSELRVTQLREQFTQVPSAFQVRAMSR